MSPNFIKPTSASTKMYNLEHVYKVEVMGVEYKFYLVGGESFTMNSGHVPKEIKAVMTGEK